MDPYRTPPPVTLRRVAAPPPRADASVIGTALVVVGGLGILAGLATPRCALELAIGVTIVILVVRAKLADFVEARAAWHRRLEHRRRESLRPEARRAE